MYVCMYVVCMYVCSVCMSCMYDVCVDVMQAGKQPSKHKYTLQAQASRSKIK